MPAQAPRHSPRHRSSIIAEVRSPHVVIGGVENAVAVTIGGEIRGRTERVTPKRVVRSVYGAVVIVVAGLKSKNNVVTSASGAGEGVQERPRRQVVTEDALIPLAHDVELAVRPDAKAGAPLHMVVRASA